MLRNRFQIMATHMSTQIDQAVEIFHRALNEARQLSTNQSGQRQEEEDVTAEQSAHCTA